MIFLRPTDEQKAVTQSSGRVVRINARAGTGKTTTLAMLATKQKNTRVLYLVFNRRAREEAQQVFPANTQVRTIHALAYRKEGYKWKDTLGHFSPADMLYAFGPDEQIVATLSHDFLVFFLNSPFPRLEDAVRSFRRYLAEPAWALFCHYQPRIIAACRKIATEWNTGRRPCPHDFYLKLCHKSGAFQAELNRYDLILVDEAQDLSPIMLDALRACRQRIVLVGDSHQQIYSFRYAMDAMRTLRCDEKFDLTLSFRFGSLIADLTSLFIREAKQEQQFRILGNRKKASKIGLYRRIEQNNKLGTAVLTRSNVALFENAMALRGRVVPFRFEKDIQALLMKTLDVYWLAEDRRDKVRDGLIKSFATLDDLEEYAKLTENFQLQGMIETVRKYVEEFPAVIFELVALSKQQRESSEKTGIILSTIHSAKGQEYDQVYIDADMADNLEKVFKNDLEHVSDEVNVAYVGFTRAKQALQLPHEFTSVLTSKWSDFLTQQHSVSKPRRKGKLRPGDVVETRKGPGVILEISGDYCLIDLDQQEMKLRERVANLHRSVSYTKGAP